MVATLHAAKYRYDTGRPFSGYRMISGLNRNRLRSGFIDQATIPRTNIYGYVGGNPISYTDPTGKIVWVPAGAIAGAVAGSISGMVGAAMSPNATIGGVLIAGAVGGATGAVAGGVGAAAIGSVLVGATAAMVGEATSQLLTTGQVNGDMVGTAGMIGGTSAFSIWGLTAIGAPLWLANAMPAQVATALYVKKANAATLGNQCP